jgi:hypothetical protein
MYSAKRGGGRQVTRSRIAASPAEFPDFGEVGEPMTARATA